MMMKTRKSGKAMDSRTKRLRSE